MAVIFAVNALILLRFRTTVRRSSSCSLPKQIGFQQLGGAESGKERRIDLMGDGAGHFNHALKLTPLRPFRLEPTSFEISCTSRRKST